MLGLPENASGFIITQKAYNEAYLYMSNLEELPTERGITHIGYYVNSCGGINIGIIQKTFSNGSYLFSSFPASTTPLTETMSRQKS